MPRMPAVAQPVHRALHDRERLPAVDRPLHLRIDVLHAEARAVDADRRERSDRLPRQAPRIDLDRELGSVSGSRTAGAGARPGSAGRPGASMVGVPPPKWMWPTVRRPPSAAPMRSSSAQQQVLIFGHRPIAPRHGGVAAAIPAELLAERHVQVEGEPGVGRQLGEPAAVIVRTDAGMEVRRRRIARVARHRAVVLGQKLGVHVAKCGSAVSPPP